MCVYNDIDLNKIAGALGRCELSEAIVERLEEAAFEFQVAAMSDRDPGYKEKRQRLRSIKGYAEKLAVELKALDALTSQDLLIGIIPDGDSVTLLAMQAAELEAKIPKRGGEPQLARHVFVGALATIFCDITGEPATRRHNQCSGKDYGPFLDFVCAAIRPIDAKAEDGIEHVVRDVLEAQRKSDNSADSNNVVR